MVMFSSADQLQEIFLEIVLIIQILPNVHKKFANLIFNQFQSVSGSLRRRRWPGHLLAWLADTYTLTPHTEANIAEITKVSLKQSHICLEFLLNLKWLFHPGHVMWSTDRHHVRLLRGEIMKRYPKLNLFSYKKAEQTKMHFITHRIKHYTFLSGYLKKCVFSTDLTYSAECELKVQKSPLNQSSIRLKA